MCDSSRVELTGEPGTSKVALRFQKVSDPCCKHRSKPLTVTGNWPRQVPGASPILSGLSSLKETVEVPSPPDLVVTLISPLSSLAGPTRQTILLADIHSAVNRQLWPQMDRPDGEEGRTA